MRLKEYIQTKRIIADGAFGTYYMSLYGDGSKPEKGLASDRDFSYNGGSGIRPSEKDHAALISRYA